MANSKECACHVGSFGVCDYPGGCGSAGGCCAPTPRPGSCTVCLLLRPDADPRLPHHPPVCDGDRELLDTWLGEINRLHAQLTEPEPAIVDKRQHDRWATAYLPGGHRHTWNKGPAYSDPLAPLGGVSPINSRPNSPRTSGSRERPMPIRADLHDLTSPARGVNLTGAGRQHPEDHVGELPAATILDGWVRSWRDTLHPSQGLPPASVPELTRWLRIRLDDACDRYPIIDEFADEIRDLRGKLRAQAGETDPKPERCEQVACKRCDMEMMFRRPDGSGDVDCLNPACNAVMRDTEYREWVATLLAQKRIEQQQNA